MPHFVIHCSENITKMYPPKDLMRDVHDTAMATGLFQPNIKVRIQPFDLYNVVNTQDDFIHIFGNIMEGRTIEQKTQLSKDIVTRLKSIFPEVPVLSINIQEFVKATYCNQDMV